MVMINYSFFDTLNLIRNLYFDKKSNLTLSHYFEQKYLQNINHCNLLRNLIDSNIITQLSEEFSGNSIKNNYRVSDVECHEAWAVINKYNLFVRDPLCSTCTFGKPLQVHHSNYAGGLILEDFRRFSLLCKRCHIEGIHTNSDGSYRKIGN